MPKLFQCTILPWRAASVTIPAICFESVRRCIEASSRCRRCEEKPAASGVCTSNSRRAAVGVSAWAKQTTTNAASPIAHRRQHAANFMGSP